jgi:thiol-disulfide isomerase/thioredoxin
MEKQSTFKSIVAVLFVAVIILAVFLFTSNREKEDGFELSDTETEIQGEEGDSEKVSDGDSESTSIYSGEILAGSTSPFIVFNETDYKLALEEDKTILLYFFAKWCPTCKRELRNEAQPAFDSYDGDNIVAFRVNFNDRDMSDFEEDLADSFGVLYQHTKVFIKNGEMVSKAPNSWTQEEYLEAFRNNQ